MNLIAECRSQTCRLNQMVWMLVPVLIASLLISSPLTAPLARADDTPQTQPGSDIRPVTLTPDTTGKYLGANRWREYSRGVSILGPKDIEPDPLPAKDALVTYVDPNRFAISVTIKEGVGVQENIVARYKKDVITSVTAKPDIISINGLMTGAISQIGLAHPTAAILDQIKFDLTTYVQNIDKPLGDGKYERYPIKHSGAAAYFLIPPPDPTVELEWKQGKHPRFTYTSNQADAKRPTYVMGVAFIQIDAITYIRVKLEADKSSFDSIRPIFEAMVASIDILPSLALDEWHKRITDNAKQWHQGIKFESLKAAIIPEQLFRIVDQNIDIGYMKIIQKLDKQMDNNGITVEIQYRTFEGDTINDGKSSFFLSEDNNSELWSIRLARRSAIKERQAQAKNAEVQDELTWIETGLRNRGRIQVERASLSDVTKKEWQIPQELYLSQVEILMLDSILPKKQPVELGFYAYNAGTAKLDFRTEKVLNSVDGKVTQRSRVAPDRPEQVSLFSVSGPTALIQREMPGGRLLIPTTPQELKLKWATR